MAYYNYLLKLEVQVQADKATLVVEEMVNGVDIDGSEN